MARPKSDNPRKNQVLVRLTDAGIAELDRLRAQTTRAEYIRQLLARESRVSRMTEQHKPVLDRLREE